jgi:hypothetical protein
MQVVSGRSESALMLVVPPGIGMNLYTRNPRKSVRWTMQWTLPEAFWHEYIIARELVTLRYA